MADQQNQPKWYHTVPGYVTATATLIGSIAAAAAGLSQLGVFHKSTPAPTTPPASVSTSTAAQRSGSGASHRAPETRAPETRAQSRPAAPPPASQPAHATVPASTPPPAPAPAPATAPAPAPTPPPPPAAPVSKTGTIGPGTTLELSSGSRVCSTDSKTGDKFTATTVAPVSGSNGVTLPSGTQVILSVEVQKAPKFISANGVSLNVGGKTVKVGGAASAQTEFAAGANQKGFGIGACIPAGRTHLAAALGRRDDHHTVAGGGNRRAR